MDKILVLGNQTNYDFKQNPTATKDVVSGYEIITPECEKCKEIIIKTDNKSIKLNEFIKGKDNFMQHYAPSMLFKNTYYPLYNFEKLYEKDLIFLCKKIFGMLGAESNCTVEIQEESKIEEYSKNDGDINLKTPSADFKSKIKEERTKTDEKKHSIKNSSGGFNLKVSSQELKNYIEKEKIEVDYLPDELRILIEHYIKFHELICNKGSYIEHTEEISSYIEENNSLALDLSASIGKMPKFLSIDLNIKMNSKINKKYNKKLYYKVIF